MDKRFFFPNIPAPSETFSLPPEEAKHLKTKRVQSGDIIAVVDGKGTMAGAEVISPNVKHSELRVMTVKKAAPLQGHGIHIAVAPTKNAERIEWFLEKAVEIGIREVSFPITTRTEKKSMKSERLFKKSVEALKQSKQYYLPKINPLSTLEETLDSLPDGVQVFAAYMQTGSEQHLMHLAKPGHSYCIFIGPEGGFTPEEANMMKDRGATFVNLGTSRLRTETAALYACTALNLLQLQK